MGRSQSGRNQILGRTFYVVLFKKISCPQPACCQSGVACCFNEFREKVILTVWNSTPFNYEILASLTVFWLLARRQFRLILLERGGPAVGGLGAFESLVESHVSQVEKRAPVQTRLEGQPADCSVCCRLLGRWGPLAVPATYSNWNMREDCSPFSKVQKFSNSFSCKHVPCGVIYNRRKWVTRSSLTVTRLSQKW